MQGKVPSNVTQAEQGELQPRPANRNSNDNSKIKKSARGEFHIREVHLQYSYEFCR